MRLRACREAGIKEVPVIHADNLTPDQQREFIIKDNVSGGEWDWEMLANEWDAEELDDWGLDIPDFGEVEDQKDLSDELSETFEVIISCVNEKDQEQTFKKLQSEGYECRVLTL